MGALRPRCALLYFWHRLRCFYSVQWNFLDFRHRLLISFEYFYSSGSRKIMENEMWCPLVSTVFPKQSVSLNDRLEISRLPTVTES
jgi:hypothetical protein